MSKVIVYQESGRNLSVIHPSNDLADIVRIGNKHVPYGVEFWIIDKSELPNDRVFREAWVLNRDDLGPANGMGGE